MPMISRASWKWIGAGVLVAGVVAGPMLIGRTEPVTRERLTAARQQWAAAKLADYDMELDSSGAQTGRYHVEVRGGTLTHITRNGQPADPAQGHYWTVEGLFDTIEEEVDLIEHPSSGSFSQGRQAWLRMRCHPTLGYPLRYIRQVPGTTLGVEMRVRSLEAK